MGVVEHRKILQIVYEWLDTIQGEQDSTTKATYRWLQEITGFSQPTISRCLDELQAIDRITRTKEGNRTRISVSRPCKPLAQPIRLNVTKGSVQEEAMLLNLPLGEPLAKPTPLQNLINPKKALRMC